jgi:hypothetical protein
VLFLLSELRGGPLEFSNTYPVILIVVGAISLAAALAPMDGHLTDAYPPVPPAATPSAPPPPLAGAGQGQ